VAWPILWSRMQALMERHGDCAVNWKLMCQDDESAAASSYLEDSARNDTNHQKNCPRLRWCLREPTMEQ